MKGLLMLTKEIVQKKESLFAMTMPVNAISWFSLSERELSFVCRACIAKIIFFSYASKMSHAVKTSGEKKSYEDILQERERERKTMVDYSYPGLPYSEYTCRNCDFSLSVLVARSQLWNLVKPGSVSDQAIRRKYNDESSRVCS